MRLFCVQIFWIFGILLFDMGVSFGQPVGYRAGEVLVMLSPNTSPDEVLRRLPDALKRETHICFDYRLTRQLNVWLVRTAPLAPSQYSILCSQLRTNPNVWEVQYNFNIALRTNDPYFEDQWYLQNVGENGGVVGADIHALNAWAQATQATNPLLGDTAVICLIEAGYPDHEELEYAFWHNLHEIPNNYFDDDGNGFIDDYDGWNIVSQTDECNATAHANAVCGVMAARTNNNEGIAGINWQASVMRVAIPEPTEAQLIAAYEYPMLMRRLYNQTNGEKGAFVVVANSSFGIDLAQSADHPLWCSMYDYMGAEGIINVAATSNQNNNVDVVGDMPSGCSSPYLVICTSTNNKDIRNNTAYGATTVDIAAPGNQILSTDEDNDYDEFTGTSMATPMVTAAISLLYGLPCTLPANAIKNPSATALNIKNTLLASADVLPQLTGTIASNGRLNIAKLLANWKNQNCPPATCAIPHHIQTVQNTSTSITLSWNNYGPPPVNTKITLQSGGLTFNVPAGSNSYTINNLQPCTAYTATITNTCSGAQSNTATYQFTTVGCCNAPVQIVTQTTSNNQLTILWQPNPYIPSYTVFFRKDGDTTWSQTTTTSNSITLYALNMCTRYFFKVVPSCSGTPSDIFQIYTAECDDCTDDDYCLPSGYTGFEWIDTLTIGNFLYYHTADTPYSSGYLMHPFSVGIVQPGALLPIRIVPGFQQDEYEEMYSVYLDANFDANFSENERIFHTDTPTTQPLNGNLLIPTNVSDDAYTRLRIIMRYYYTPEAACSPVDFGEIHDFCIQLGSQHTAYTTTDQTPVVAIPNPTTDLVQVCAIPLHCGTPTLRLFNTQGHQVLHTQQASVLSMAHLSAGIYLLQATTPCGAYMFKIIKL